MDAVRDLIDAYFEYINPIVPIIERDQVLNYLNSPPTEETYALVASLAAVPLRRVKLTNDKLRKGNLRDLLISEALRVKGTLPFVKLNDSINKAKVSFFLYLTFCGTEEFDTAWYYLHEASMIAQIMKLDVESSYKDLSPDEDLDRRLFYWGLFVSDRGFSIHEHKPVILHKTISLPQTIPTVSAPAVYNEFISLVKVMAAMDDNFISAWNGTDDSGNPEAQPSISGPIQSSVTKIQRQLLNAVSSAPRFESGIQKSNVLITQPWLLLLLWQMCKNNGSNGSSGNATFPAHIAWLAAQVSTSVSVQDLLAHGPGMRKKFYDIGYALSDSVIDDPQILYNMTTDVKSVLHRIVSMAGQLSSDKTQFKSLENKASQAMQEIEVASNTRWMYSIEVLNNIMDFAAGSTSEPLRGIQRRASEISDGDGEFSDSSVEWMSTTSSQLSAAEPFTLQNSKNLGNSTNNLTADTSISAIPGLSSFQMPNYQSHTSGASHVQSTDPAITSTVKEESFPVEFNFESDLVGWGV